MTATKTSSTRRFHLAREIVIVLAVKFAALILIWSIWFAHPQGASLDARSVAAQLYTALDVTQQRSGPDAQP